MSHSLNRRRLMRAAMASALGVASMSALGARAATNATASTSSATAETTALKGNIRHSVARWTFNFLSLEELCLVVRRLGFSAIDLVGPGEWQILKQHGIDSSMCNGAELNLEDGWGDTRFHKPLIESYRKHIDLVADAGYQNLICFSGNARGMDPEDGLKNATIGLKKILAQAEKRGVVLQMELFNSKIDHPDYLCDNSAWGIELCKRLDSPNFKLLYDIYHMQISEGDIIRTIQNNHQYFGHYHTAGVPGRNEIDDTQELFYPAIVRAIQATGFKGYVAQEFMPKRATDQEKIESLQAAIRICDV
jgi:hydroxypyruvate isomerase